MSYENHNSDYKAEGKVWEEYTTFELAMWSYLLRKRATMRTDAVKAKKDNYDADNYFEMFYEMLQKEIAAASDPSVGLFVVMEDILEEDALEWVTAFIDEVERK